MLRFGYRFAAAVTLIVCLTLTLRAETKTLTGFDLSKRAQDRITRVSEPSTLLFLGTAFFAIATLTRRTRKTA